MHNTGEILADPDDTRETLGCYAVLAKGPPHMPAISAENAIFVNAGDRARALECRDAMLARDRRDKAAKRPRQVILEGMCPDG